jgi:hypothetical protein
LLVSSSHDILNTRDDALSAPPSGRIVLRARFRVRVRLRPRARFRVRLWVRGSHAHVAQSGATGEATRRLL